MSIVGTWGYSQYGETYTAGFKTREEACEEAVACGYNRYHVGKLEAPILESAIDADDLLEKVLCQDDYCGDWAEDALECTDAQRAELTQDIRCAFLLWLDRHHLRPSFGVVRNPEEVVEEQEPRPWF